MRLLLVTSVDPWTRSVSTVHHLVSAGRRLGHEVALFGEPNEELPDLPFTLDTADVDLALFVIQVPTDFPDMPHLARLLDRVPREKRVVVDLWGRFNDTVRVAHDFNHLEKIDGHLGWEWEDAFRATSDVIVQPTAAPLRPNVGTFWFHGFEPSAVVVPDEDAATAAARWRGAGPDAKPFGIMYAGSNWQRWEQVRSFLEAYGAVKDKIGRACLAGWDWGSRPDWAIEQGIMGIDTDPAFLASQDVEVWDGVRFEYIVEMLGQARFVPVFHRPLFRQLAFVTGRSFETFHADAMPVLMLPGDFVEQIYGPAARMLAPDGDVAAHLLRVLDEPERHWQALLDTRAYLAAHHSYERRYEELAQLGARAGAGG